MSTGEYRFFLVPVTKTEVSEGRAVELDESVFAPAIEWTHFSSMRRRLLPPFSSPCGSLIIPRWARDPGVPFLDGFDVKVIGAAGTVAFSVHFPLSYFQQHVRRLIRQTSSAASEEITLFHVCAVPDTDKGACETAGSSFLVEEIQRPLALREASLVSLLKASSRSPVSDTLTTPEIDMPVFITEEVIAKAAEHSRDAGANEAGGILAGYLCRGNDNDHSDIFVVISSQIRAPVGKKDTGATRIRFSHKTWAFFQESLKKGNRGETMIGWYHSHPLVNKTAHEGNQCCSERKCSSSVFFSTADINFHRVAFSQAYNTALVVGYTPCAMLNCGLFGWRGGTIVKRDFYILRKTESELQEILFQGGYHVP